MLRHGDLPVELRTLLRDVVRDLTTVRTHIHCRNYGLADDWVNEALNKLPKDYGETIDWPALEERTS